MNCAIGRKLERERKNDDMDIGITSGSAGPTGEDSWGLSALCEALGLASTDVQPEEEGQGNDINALGKGKGQKGKGWGKQSYPPGLGKGNAASPLGSKIGVLVQLLGAFKGQGKGYNSWGSTSWAGKGGQGQGKGGQGGK